MRRLGAQTAGAPDPGQTTAQRYRAAILNPAPTTIILQQRPPSTHGLDQQSFLACKICMETAHVAMRRFGKNTRLFVRRTISFRRGMTFAMLLSREKKLSPRAVEHGRAS
jgi:hypothetical protein